MISVQVSRHQQLAERLQELHAQRAKLAGRASQIASRLEIAKLERAKALIDEVDIAPQLPAEIASLTEASASIAQALELLDKDIAATEPQYHAAQRQHLVSQATAEFEKARADAIAARDAIGDATMEFIRSEFRRLIDAVDAAQERGRAAAKGLQELANQDPTNHTMYNWPIDRFRSGAEASLLTQIDQLSRMANFGQSRS